MYVARDFILSHPSIHCPVFLCKKKVKKIDFVAILHGSPSLHGPDNSNSGSGDNNRQTVASAKYSYKI